MTRSAAVRNRRIRSSKKLGPSKRLEQAIRAY
jgi:hypothetical protein